MKIRLAKKLMNTRIDHRIKKAARLISKYNYRKFNKQ